MRSIWIPARPSRPRALQSKWLRRQFNNNRLLPSTRRPRPIQARLLKRQIRYPSSLAGAYSCSFVFALVSSGGWMPPTAGAHSSPSFPVAAKIYHGTPRAKTRGVFYFFVVKSFIFDRIKSRNVPILRSRYIFYFSTKKMEHTRWPNHKLQSPPPGGQTQS
jgi:hypothetical protein